MTTTLREEIKADEVKKGSGMMAEIRSLGVPILVGFAFLIGFSLGEDRRRPAAPQASETVEEKPSDSEPLETLPPATQPYSILPPASPPAQLYDTLPPATPPPAEIIPEPPRTWPDDKVTGRA